jgi:cellobiose phosphorylase
VGPDISGDLPVVLVRVGASAALPLVRQLLKRAGVLAGKGLRPTSSILNEQKTDYLDEMQQLLLQMVQESPWVAGSRSQAGTFLLRADGMAEADRQLLGAVARVVLPGDLGDLSSQLERPAVVALRRAQRTAPRRSCAHRRRRRSR